MSAANHTYFHDEPIIQPATQKSRPNWRLALAMVVNLLMWFGVAVWLADGFATFRLWVGI